MILVAFVLFFLLVVAWLVAPSKTPAVAQAPAAPALLPGAATA